ncbi:MAG: lipoprotein-releasing system permease protein [Verrucomicrobiales bacterium]|jgi:lipoprotein-releasing system permease protein
MTKNFSYFLAKRYLMPKGLFMILINVLTIVGVCLGVAVMIVVLSVMKGFENEFQRTLLGFDPHLMALTPREGESDYRQVGEMLEKVPGVISQSPFVAGHVLVQVGNQVQTPIMKAILSTDQQLQELKDRDMLVEGELDLETYVDDKNTYEQVIISLSLADSFKGPEGGPLGKGDIITVLSPVTMTKVLNKIRDYKELPEDQRDEADNFLNELEEAMVPQELMISGIVKSPMYQQFIIPSLLVGQQLFGYEENDEVHGLAVFVEDPYEIEQVKERMVNSALPMSWEALSWVDQNKSRLDAIRMERSMMSFILFIIVIVATFCVTVTIIVTTVQKRREIGVLKAIGARTEQIVRVFVHQGQIVGLCGVLSGVAIGLLVLYQLESIRSFIGMFGADPFPQSIYGLAKLPVEIIPSSIIGIAIGAMVACTIAALPAWFVARLDPAKALRSD